MEPPSSNTALQETSAETGWRDRPKEGRDLSSVTHGKSMTMPRLENPDVLPACLSTIPSLGQTIPPPESTLPKPKGTESSFPPVLICGFSPHSREAAQCLEE